MQTEEHMAPWAMKIFRKWKCKREDRGETPLHIGISMEINEVNWCWVPTTWERLAIWWPPVTLCQVSQKTSFLDFLAREKLKNNVFWEKSEGGIEPGQVSQKSSFLDFLGREKLKNDVFWENALGRSSPNVLVCTEAFPGEEPAWTGACNP